MEDNKKAPVPTPAESVTVAVKREAQNAGTYRIKPLIARKHQTAYHIVDGVKYDLMAQKPYEVETKREGMPPYKEPIAAVNQDVLAKLFEMNHPFVELVK